MTQEELIDMVRDSGMEVYGLGKNRARFVHHLEAFAKLVAEHEREKCAEIAKWHQDMAAEIRARGQVALCITGGIGQKTTGENNLS